MNKKGFTLIELIIVIAVIAILASIEFQKYISLQEEIKVTNFDITNVSACVKDAQSDCVSRFVSTAMVTDLSSLANHSNIVI